MTSDAHSAWGEACLAAEPVECGEWSGGALACLRDCLAPALVGRQIDSGAALQQALAKWIDNQAAKSALDLAWWQLAAVARGVPLHELLGAQRDTVAVSRALRPAGCRGRSVRRNRNGAGRGLRPGDAQVPARLGPGNAACRAAGVCRRAAGHRLRRRCARLPSRKCSTVWKTSFCKHIEQPLPADDLVGHAMLQQNLRTPLALDQSITSPARVEQALDLGSCRLVRIDPVRVGGLTPALAIHDLCRAANVPCVVGGGTQCRRGSRRGRRVGRAVRGDIARRSPRPWLGVLVRGGSAPLRGQKQPRQFGNSIDRRLGRSAVARRASRGRCGHRARGTVLSAPPPASAPLRSRPCFSKMRNSKVGLAEVRTPARATVRNCVEVRT